MNTYPNVSTVLWMAAPPRNMVNTASNLLPVSGQRRRTLKEWKTRFFLAWYRMQLTHFGGKYSLERALALEEYTRNASFARVMLVTTAPLFFTIAVVLGQQSIPLQDPTTGWQSKYGFWPRVGLTGAATAYVLADQVGPWLDVAGLSPRRTIFYCLGVGAGFIATGIVVAEVWVFPIPFFMLTLTAITTTILLGLFRVAIGTRAFKEILTRKEQIQRLNKIGSLQGLMTMVYPLYQVLFMNAKHTIYELPVISLLPLFKFVMKSVFASSASLKEDMVPGQVVLSVDFFDALYWATFVQSLSPTTLVVVMAADLGDIAIEFRELHLRTQSILKRVHETAGDDNSDHNNGGLLKAVRSLCYYSEVLEHQINPRIQIYSSFRHNLSSESKAHLSQLAQQTHLESSDERRATITRVSVASSSGATVSEPATKTWFQRWLGSVHPLAPVTIMPKAQRLSEKGVLERIQQQKSRECNARVLQEALEILFSSECLILSDYVETIVPIIYGSFIMAMVYLPSAKYHSEMEGITQDNVGSMVSRIFLYALLELASLVILAVILQRNCGINALYQLAFVLETQMSFVLSKLLLWMLFTLTYRVTHFGADFSFRFEWVGS